MVPDLLERLIGSDRLTADTLTDRDRLDLRVDQAAEAVTVLLQLQPHPVCSGITTRWVDLTSSITK